ncbi:MAG: DUF2127 domain-containing protein [Acidobacteria bacterium]|nr:DUF2127 domain-containing protein [Acidobacteriota bacterium]
MAGKGIYGCLETLAGLALLVIPTAAAQLLTSIAGELGEGTSPLRDAAARSLMTAGGGIATGAPAFALFLMVHGLVNLLTVYALLRRAVRWYPWALGALVVLLGVQVVDLLTAPAVSGWVLTALDIAVIVIVSWEYRRLRREHSDATLSATPSPALSTTLPSPGGTPEP